MATPQPQPAAPGDPARDIFLTRAAQAVRPQVEACGRELVHRFQALGLGVDTQVRPTPRGLSTFLAVTGRRGLVCIVDITLVDGMAVGHGPVVALDIRLLDACGDVVAAGLASGTPVCDVHDRAAPPVRLSANLARAATAVYVATLAHFDLLPPQLRHA